VFYRLEFIKAYGNGILKIMNACEETGMMPQIKTSDNAFKMILPNLNAKTEQKEPEDTGSESSMEEEKVTAPVIHHAFLCFIPFSPASQDRFFQREIRNYKLSLEK